MIFYYAIVIIVLVLLNTLLVPSLAERSIKEATYDEFLDTLDSGTVEEVNLEDDVIYYSVKKEMRHRFIRPVESKTHRK